MAMSVAGSKAQKLSVVMTALKAKQAQRRDKKSLTRHKPAIL